MEKGENTAKIKQRRKAIRGTEKLNGVTGKRIMCKASLKDSIPLRPRKEVPLC